MDYFWIKAFCRRQRTITFCYTHLNIAISTNFYDFKWLHKSSLVIPLLFEKKAKLVLREGEACTS